MSPFKSKVHYIPQTLTPHIAIHENEPSSILAYALVNGSNFDGPDLTLKIESPSISVKLRSYHEKKFQLLRKTLGEDEPDFIRSMMRCHNWNPRGGKSGAMFFKSHDGRFVIKQVNEFLMNAFLTDKFWVFFSEFIYLYLRLLRLMCRFEILMFSFWPPYRTILCWRIFWPRLATCWTNRSHIESIVCSLLAVRNFFYNKFKKWKYFVFNKFDSKTVFEEKAFLLAWKSLRIPFSPETILRHWPIQILMRYKGYVWFFA